METKPKATLALFAYNQEPYVRDAVRSVLAQECEPIEIILSDDCSTDRTFEIIKAEADVYTGPHRIVLNRNSKNLGLVEHVNFIFRIASGDIIIAAAGDDLSRADRTQKILDCFERDQPLLVHSDARAVDEKGDDCDHPFRNATFFRTTNVIEASVSKGLYLGATGAWHKDLYTFFGPLTYPRAYEDLTLGFRAALTGRVAFIDEPLVVYRANAGMTSDWAKDQMRADLQAVRQKSLGNFADVLRQRLADANCIDRPEFESLRDHIQKTLEITEARSAVYNGRARLVWQHRSHPGLALRAIVSEANHWRRTNRGPATQE